MNNLFSASIFSSVTILFRSSGPFTIFGRITLVVVNSFNSVFRGRALTHIRDKMVKTETT